MTALEISRTFGLVNIKVVDLYIIPGLAVLAILTNILCITVIKNLVQTCFTTSIICYSVICIGFSLNSVNFAGLICLYHSLNGNQEELFSKPGSLCFTYEMNVICLVQKVLCNSCYLMLGFMPVVIVVERFIAVYKPLRMSEIITIKRTLCLICFFTTMCIMYDCLFFYNEYELKNINKTANSTKFNRKDVFLFPRKGKIKGLNYIWLSIGIAVYVTIIGGYIALLIKTFYNNMIGGKMQALRNTSKSRNVKLLIMIIKINFSFFSLDLSAFMRFVIITTSNFYTEKQIQTFTVIDHTSALFYCSSIIFIHMLLHNDFRKESFNMFSCRKRT